jgi:hypothetical protein
MCSDILPFARSIAVAVREKSVATNSDCVRNINASHVKPNSATICPPSEWAVEIQVLSRQTASISE